MASKKSADYWKKRFELLEQSQNQQGIQCYADIERQYRQAQRQIETQIQSWYGRFASNNGVSIQDARRMLTNKELAELKWDINEYIRHGEQNALLGTWVKELENASARYHISRLEALKLQTQQQIEVLFGNQLDSIDSAMKSIYTSGYYHTAYEIQKGYGVGWDFATLDESRINKIINKPWAADGKNFSERIWGNRQKLVNELNTELTRNIILGQDPQKAIDAIAKKMNTSKNTAGRLVMTEEAFFSSAAQKDCFNELDVELFEVVATIDSHTSEICQEMDGKVFSISQWEVGVTAPPFHVWCRTTTAPAFGDEFDNIGERAARGKEGKTYHIPADMTYKEWQKSFVEGDKTGLQEVTSDDTIENTPNEKTINNCNTVEEVEDLMKNQNWFRVCEINGKTFDTNERIKLTGCDLESAKSIYATHEKLFSKFPQLKGKLNSIGSMKLGRMTYAQCSFGLGRGGITVNTLHYSNAAKLAESYMDDLRSGFHPKGTTYHSIVMHELGHAIDDYLTYTEMASGLVSGWKPKIVSADIRPKVMKACGMKISDIKSAVSGYATKDSLEWFAECFAEYMDSENPRIVAVEFGRQLEKILKGVK